MVDSASCIFVVFLWLVIQRMFCSMDPTILSLSDFCIVLIIKNSFPDVKQLLEREATQRSTQIKQVRSVFLYELSFRLYLIIFSYFSASASMSHP